MNMTGKWTGQYTYGEGYADSDHGKSVTFYLEITANGIQFEGSFTDDETKDFFDEPGILSGILENNFISFSKWYPCYWAINEWGERKFFEDEASHEICYEGVLIEDNFVGEWEIPMQFVDANGPYTVINGKGTWFMRKD